MKNFLTYKSKIVKCKRDSQKLEEFNLLQLLREFQSRKIDKRQINIIETPIEQLSIQKTLVDQLRQNSLFPQKEFKWERITPQNDKYLSKEESTMQSLCEEQQGQNKLHKEIQNKLILNNNYQKSTRQNQYCHSRIKSKVNKKGMKPQKMRKIQSQQELSFQKQKDQQFKKLSHKQSCIILDSNNQLELTLQKPLQLFNACQNKIQQQNRMNMKTDNIIKQQDQQKIDMLFRQQYKGLFSSSISDIQFKQGTNTTSSFQNELQSSQGLLANTKNVSKFSSILNALNKKDKQPSKSLMKNIDNSSVPIKKKRQRIIILNKKEQSQPIDKTKSCQKETVNKCTKAQQKKQLHNKK